MSKNLATSLIARENILNNPYTFQEVENNLHFGGVFFESELVFTKAQVAEILQIEERTIDRYLRINGDELRANGYRILRGKSLKLLRNLYVDDIYVVDISPKAPSLGIFSFRAVINLAMLVVESERARIIRSKILDIALDVTAQKSGGHPKFINQRDSSYLVTKYQNEVYREKFNQTLIDCLEMGENRFHAHTDKIYDAVFCENATEYKAILKLSEEENPRDTFYTETLIAISAFENGLAELVRQRFQDLKRKLTESEFDSLLDEAKNNPFLEPHIQDVRVKMSSRDLEFRDAFHYKLEHYIESVPQGDFDKFLGEQSKALEEQIKEAKTLEVFKRLKDR